MPPVKNWSKVACDRSHRVYEHAHKPACGMVYVFDGEYHVALTVKGYPIKEVEGFTRKKEAGKCLYELVQQIEDPSVHCDNCGSAFCPPSVEFTRCGTPLKTNVTTSCPNCGTTHTKPETPIPETAISYNLTQVPEEAAISP